jgi:hypothetical protein
MSYKHQFYAVSFNKNGEHTHTHIKAVSELHAKALIESKHGANVEIEEIYVTGLEEYQGKIVGLLASFLARGAGGKAVSSVATGITDHYGKQIGNIINSSSVSDAVSEANKLKDHIAEDLSQQGKNLTDWARSFFTI